jgi:hypothetical protein
MERKKRERKNRIGSEDRRSMNIQYCPIPGHIFEFVSEKQVAILEERG